MKFFSNNQCLLKKKLEKLREQYTNVVFRVHKYRKHEEMMLMDMCYFVLKKFQKAQNKTFPFSRNTLKYTKNKNLIHFLKSLSLRIKKKKKKCFLFLPTKQATQLNHHKIKSVFAWPRRAHLTRKICNTWFCWCVVYLTCKRVSETNYLNPRHGKSRTWLFWDKKKPLAECLNGLPLFFE